MSISDSLLSLLEQKKQSYEHKKNDPDIWDKKLDKLYELFKEWLTDFKESYLEVYQATDFNDGFYKKGKEQPEFDYLAIDRGDIHPKTIIIRFFNGNDTFFNPVQADISNGFGRVDVDTGLNEWFLVAKDKASDDWILFNPYTEDEYPLNKDTFLEKIIFEIVNRF